MVPFFFFLVVLLGTSTSPSADAQLDLQKTIQDLSGWPCSDYTWADCPQVVPDGGYEPAKWYEVTQWSAYDVLAADGKTKGRDAYVWEAFQLFDALENRENARITVMQSIALSSEQWPFGGYPVQRDVVIKSDPGCAGGGDGGAEIPGRCTIQCAGLTLFVVTRDGSLHMQGLTLLNGGGRLGGFVFVAPGGGGVFEDVAFVGGSSTFEKASGGAAMITSGDRAGGVPHNITFRRCNFTDNAVSEGDGGALWIKQAGLGWVIFDECSFTSNRAGKGSGGAVFSLGGRVIFAACNFTENAAEAGGALLLQGGGLVGGGVFTANRATARSGGAIFALGRNGLIQDTLFRRNSAAVEGGAVFVYGAALFITNDFVSNAAGNVHPDVYICSDANRLGAGFRRKKLFHHASPSCSPYNSETRQYYDVKYDPFPSGEKNPPVLVKE